MTPVFELQSVHKTFTDFWGRPRKEALRGVSLSGTAGEVLGLLGPNGAGKSTAIKTLLGLLRPTSGDVRLFGRAPTEASARARIGFLPELPVLHKFLTPEETLSYHAGLLGLNRATSATRIPALLDRVGIASADRRRPVGEFSKGMARRVGLALALLGDPEFVVLDEPTSGLDPLGRHDTKALIKDLAREGKTILFSSHLLSEVEDVCTRVAVLVDGRVCAEGALETLLSDETAVQATVSGLTEEGRARLAEVLAREGFDATVAPARRSLEAYFLSVVRRP